MAGAANHSPTTVGVVFIAVTVEIGARRSLAGAASYSPTTVGVVFIAVAVEIVRGVRWREQQATPLRYF